MVVILLGVMITFMVLNSRSQKKRAQETQEMLNAIGPGNKVKTIGGICGIVVEVNPEDNTFVLETGSETHGKSYIKFDKQAVYQTDAVAKKPETAEEPKSEETPVAEPVETEEKTEK
jgi:preprotein translocase subunit YajC